MYNTYIHHTAPPRVCNTRTSYFWCIWVYMTNPGVQQAYSYLNLEVYPLTDMAIRAHKRTLHLTRRLSLNTFLMCIWRLRKALCFMHLAALLVFSSHVRWKSSLATVDVVVSLCNESPADVQILTRTIQPLRSHFRVQMHTYCKCIKTRPLCTVHLPNVGREGQTFMYHIFHYYNNLADLTIFINGGYASKVYTKFTIDEIVKALVRQQSIRKTANSWYFDACDIIPGGDPGCDAGINSAPKPSVWQPLGTTLHHQHMTCMAYQSRFCSSENSCHISNFPCIKGQQCGCDWHRDCSWHGSTPNNRNELTSELQPVRTTEPTNFYAWLCEYFNLRAEDAARCGSSYGAVFAVGSARIFRYTRGTYLNILREFNSSGPNGGLLGHYLERAYRPIFCTQGD